METNLCKVQTNRMDNGLMAVLYDKQTNKYLGEVIIYTRFPEEYNAYQAFKEVIKRADTLNDLFDSFHDFAKEWNAVIQTRRNFSRR